MSYQQPSQQGQNMMNNYGQRPQLINQNQMQYVQGGMSGQAILPDHSGLMGNIGPPQGMQQSPGMGPVMSSGGNPTMYHQHVHPQHIQLMNQSPQHMMSQQQQQQQQQAALNQQPKEMNIASLCKIGQETVQEIVSRTQDMFGQLRTVQPPTGSASSINVCNERKSKIQEGLKSIRLLFKRLRLVYDKCNENCAGMEYTHLEGLIPLKDEPEGRVYEERRQTEAYRQISEEHREIIEQVVMKNRHLRELIDHLRSIVWEINTMLAMRKPSKYGL